MTNTRRRSNKNDSPTIPIGGCRPGSRRGRRGGRRYQWRKHQEDLAERPAESAISLKQTSLGQTLVDANGRTLYLFEGDKRNVSMLSTAGQAVWPPFTSSTKPHALNGAIAGRIGTIGPAGGSAQVTYKGHPLYYYVGDHSSGQTSGQGLNQFGALWYAVAASGTAVTSASSSPARAAPSGCTGSYGY